MDVWYLSFGSPDTGKFLGACFIYADSIVDAASKARHIGCNPGGEVKGMTVHPSPVDPLMYNRLLSRVELEEYFGSVERF